MPVDRTRHLLLRDIPNTLHSLPFVHVRLSVDSLERVDPSYRMSRNYGSATEDMTPQHAPKQRPMVSVSVLPQRLIDAGPTLHLCAFIDKTPELLWASY
ncbi:hypothetical protein BD413DRAFT_215985 [Trametes elegans]|nr:hypothetical protein BD413DRAFT_215985 [Trametes elegans]